VKKTQEEDYRRRPFAFNPQRSFNHDHEHPKKEFGRNAPQKTSFTPKYVNLFMVIIFIVLTLDVMLYIAGLVKEMFKQEKLMWDHMTLNVTSAITMDA